MSTTPTELEEVDAVRSYLVGRGLAGAADLTIERLFGGVSSHVYRVRSSRDCFVLKQARRRLDVGREWIADPRRSEIEAAFASVAARVVPDAVPRPRFADAGRHVFAMDCAPKGAATWKSHLLAGAIDPSLGERAGQLLGRIHAATRGDDSLAARFGDLDLFAQLRIDPYLRFLSVVDSVAQTRIDELVSRLLGPGQALVHGDFSPKNLLVAPDGRLLLVDHEVAHYGDPAFDVAFCLSHLCLKAFRAPHQRGRLLETAAAFAAAYEAIAGMDEPSFEERAAYLVSALMLARVDGKSPVDYLDGATQAAVRAFASGQLATEQRDISTLLRAVDVAMA